MSETSVEKSGDYIVSDLSWKTRRRSSYHKFHRLQKLFALELPKLPSLGSWIVTCNRQPYALLSCLQDFTSCILRVSRFRFCHAQPLVFVLVFHYFVERGSYSFSHKKCSESKSSWCSSQFCWSRWRFANSWSFAKWSRSVQRSLPQPCALNMLHLSCIRYYSLT